MSFIKKPYNVFHWPKESVPSPSLCHKPSLFLNETMKNQVLNKIVCSMMESYFFIPRFLSLFSTFSKLPRHTG
jgi:hypothetical protein